jgi:hypothetical protein
MNGLQFAALLIAAATLYWYATTDKRKNMKSLNDMMEFDHVVEVLEDGTVNETPGIFIYAELNVNPAGEDEFSLEEGWELLQGFTGQYGYRGPVMHPSEFIGGGLERHILETPGYYVALVVNAYCDYSGETQCEEDSGCDCEPAGWAIAFKAKD